MGWGKLLGMAVGVAATGKALQILEDAPRKRKKRRKRKQMMI